MQAAVVVLPREVRVAWRLLLALPLGGRRLGLTGLPGDVGQKLVLTLSTPVVLLTALRLQNFG